MKHVHEFKTRQMYTTSEHGPTDENGDDLPIGTVNICRCGEVESVSPTPPPPGGERRELCGASIVDGLGNRYFCEMPKGHEHGQPTPPEACPGSVEPHEWHHDFCVRCGQKKLTFADGRPAPPEGKP